MGDRFLARLVVRQAPDLRPDRGRDQGREFSLTGDTVLIGRAKDATLSLNSSNVSKRHAEVSCRNGSYFIHDLASTQGTKLNGLPVSLNPASPTKLKTGDRIALADTVLEFIDEIPGEPKTLPGTITVASPLQAPPPSSAAAAKVPEASLSVPPMNVTSVPSAPVVVAPIKKSTQILSPTAEAPQPGGAGRPLPINNPASKVVQPVCLILDGSGSMVGEPIAAVKAGLIEFFKLIKANPSLRESLDVSMIFFGSAVKVIPGPYTQGSAAERELAAFKPSGLCSLGSAIRESMRVHASVAERRRPPLFFVAIDGVATDAFDESVHALSSQNSGQLIACEWGEHGDASPVAACAARTLTMKRLDKPSFEILMRWLVEVVKVMLSDSGDRHAFKWPPLPEGGAVALKA